MKLVYVTYHYPAVGGEGYRSVEQLKLLLGSFDVTLISLYGETAQTLPLPSGVSEAMQLSPEKRKVSLISQANPLPFLRSFQGFGDPITASKLDLSQREILRREIARLKPGIVIARAPAIVYLLNGQRQPGQVFVADMVDSMQRFFQSILDYGDFFLKPPALLYKKLAAMSERGLRGYDTMTFITEADRRFFSGPINTEILPDIKHPVPVQAVKKKFDAVLFGSWSYYPNYHGLLHFSRNILPLMKERRIAVIGKLPPKIAAVLEKYDNVTATGYLEDDEFGRTVASSYASISPVLIGAGQQNKVLDALGMGVPVIATPLFAESNPSAPVSIAGKPAEFGESLKKILDLPKADYSALSEKCRDFYVDYSEKSELANQKFFSGLEARAKSARK